MTKKEMIVKLQAMIFELECDRIIEEVVPQFDATTFKPNSKADFHYERSLDEFRKIAKEHPYNEEKAESVRKEIGGVIYEQMTEAELMKMYATSFPDMG
jgi:hypothetical protein